MRAPLMAQPPVPLYYIAQHFLPLLLVPPDAIVVCRTAVHRAIKSVFEEFQISVIIPSLDDMCLGKRREESDEEDPPYEEEPENLNIFSRYESQYAVQRALLLHRLVHDPFYTLMNLSSVSRLWMMRHLLFLHGHLQNRHNNTLLQFFESLGRRRTLKYFQFKNAPGEMIAKWDETYPYQIDENYVPFSQTVV